MLAFGSVVKQERQLKGRFFYCRLYAEASEAFLLERYISRTFLLFLFDDICKATGLGRV